jgi:Ulp1 family protease
VQRWCADVDLESKDVLFFPINLHRNHWSVVVARVRERELLCVVTPTRSLPTVEAHDPLCVLVFVRVVREFIMTAAR